MSSLHQSDQSTALITENNKEVEVIKEININNKDGGNSPMQSSSPCELSPPSGCSRANISNDPKYNGGMSKRIGGKTVLESEHTSFSVLDKEEIDIEYENVVVEESVKDQSMSQEFKAYVLDNKVNLKLDSDILGEELNILLCEIYRKHIMRSFDQEADKFVNSYSTFKKNLDKVSSGFYNTLYIKILFTQMSKIFEKFRNCILNNKIYKGMKDSFKEFNESENQDKNDQKRRVFIIKYQNKIMGLFEDIALIYKAVVQSSADIEGLFKHSLAVIAKLKNVNLKIENLQRDRLYHIIFENEFIKKFLKEIFREQYNDLTYIVKCQDMVKKIKNDLIQLNALEDSKELNKLQFNENDETFRQTYLDPEQFSDFHHHHHAQKMTHHHHHYKKELYVDEEIEVIPEKTSLPSNKKTEPQKSVEELYEYIMGNEMGNEQGEGKNRSKKKKAVKKAEKKQKSFQLTKQESYQSENGFEEVEIDLEFEEFKKRILADSKSAKIKKIQPKISKEWIKDLVIF